MTTTETYRQLRREDPYMSARTALALAHADDDADRAGVPRWFYGDEGYDLSIEGETFTLRIEYDYDFPPDWGDLGSVKERDRDRDYIAPYCYESVPPWPCVALPAGSDGSGTQGGYYGPLETYFDPGDSWEEWNPGGMARGPLREFLRRSLVAEGLRQRSTYQYGVTVTDDDENTMSLWGVDLSFDGSALDRAYLWHVVSDLAHEIRHGRAERAEQMARDIFTRLAMTSPHG
jgi:hypothetical protein